MAAGFVHGVLNTDNMNVTGESFDYGPYRFLPVLDPDFVDARPSPPSAICESAGHGNAPGSAARSRVTPAPTARIISAIERGRIAGSRPPRRWSPLRTAASRSTVRAWASA